MINSKFNSSWDECANTEIKVLKQMQFLSLRNYLNCQEVKCPEYSCATRSSNFFVEKHTCEVTGYLCCT